MEEVDNKEPKGAKLHTIRTSYSLYKERNPEAVEINVYIKIVQGLFKYMIKKMFEGYEVKMFSRLGSLQIVGRKVRPRVDEQGNVKGLAPNWAETKKLWDNDPKAKEEKQLVYCFNENTMGIRYKCLWSKKNVNTKNKGIYSFRLVRANKRKINQLANEGKEYLVIR